MTKSTTVKIIIKKYSAVQDLPFLLGLHYDMMLPPFFSSSSSLLINTLLITLSLFISVSLNISVKKISFTIYDNIFTDFKYLDMGNFGNLLFILPQED